MSLHTALRTSPMSCRCTRKLSELLTSELAGAQARHEAHAGLGSRRHFSLLAKGSAAIPAENRLSMNKVREGEGHHPNRNLVRFLSCEQKTAAGLDQLSPANLSASFHHDGTAPSFLSHEGTGCE